MNRYKNLFQYLAAEWFNFLGGMAIGLSVPFGHNFLPFPDFLIFLPLGILLIGTSLYYKFYKKY